MTGNKKEQGLVLAAMTGAAVLVLAITLTKVMIGGPLRPVLEDMFTRAMIKEVILLFLWNLLCLSQTKHRGWQAGGVLAGAAVFSWCHQIFLPLIVSGIYMVSLAAIGRRLFRALWKEHRKEGPGNNEMPVLEQWSLGLVLGFSLWILLVCLVSLTGYGGVPFWRKTAAVLSAAALTGEAAAYLKKRRKDPLYKGTPGALLSWLPDRRTEALLLAFILTMLFIQAGRMNLELDYDSLHYGLRSPYVLDNGKGIYEDLGMINLVYTYSKGLEVLCLPLSGTPTYGFVLAFSFWATAGILMLACGIPGRTCGKMAGLWAGAVIAAIPGIMNMAATAKSDNMTLLLQLIIYDFLCLAVSQAGRREKGQMPWLLMAVAAYLLTLVLKPTALVFSTALGGVALLCLFLTYLKEREKNREDHSGRNRKDHGEKTGKSAGFSTLIRYLFVLFLPGAAAAGLLYRTWLFTGVPVTSIFASLFERIGFQVRYPYNFTHVIGNPSALGTGDKLERLGMRLKGIVFAPVGPDMAHVIIAWGTGLIFLLAVVWTLVSSFRGKDRNGSISKTNLDFFDRMLITVLFLGSAASIYTLLQVDGNYFILFYAVLAVSTVRMTSQAGGIWAGRLLRRGMCALAVPVLVCNLVITCTTSWAGHPGFTSVNVKNRGYYDHREDIRYRRIRQGNYSLAMSFLPRDRVLAFGKHPQVLDLACCVQSYYDVTGSGGNVRLVKTLDAFKEFLRFSGIQYFYVEAGYLSHQPRALEIIEYMIEDGTLTELTFEWGNMKGRVDLDGTPPEDPQGAVEEFRRIYSMKENYTPGTG